MSEEELRAAVLGALSEVAPEVDLEHLERGSDLRDALEIDSMDFLNLAIAVRAATGIEVPEADYPRLASIDDWVAYLAPRLNRDPLGRETSDPHSSRSEVTSPCGHRTIEQQR